jgi:polyribonucleotide nucleotidyltransferase
MSEKVNELDLVRFIAEQTDIDSNSIRLVLKHEQDFINNAQADVNGDVEIDGDELVDYILSRSDADLDEITIETILDTEMDFLMDRGYAGYED